MEKLWVLDTCQLRTIRIDSQIQFESSLRMARKRGRGPIKLRRQTDIGAPDAESDASFLDHCFVDTGQLDQLLDCRSPKRIVVARTGAGKTALLHRILTTQDHAAELAPQTLSLTYISNSSIIRFFEAAGVNLSLFYILLWRHVLTVELLKMRFSMVDKDGKDRLFNYLESVFTKNKSKKFALAYLEEWGDKFWEQTEYRIKEFTEKLEAELSASVGGDVKIFQLGAEGAARLTKEKKAEIVTRANNTVSQVQIKTLEDIITLLSEDIFVDSQKPHYIVIDRLDEDWVDDEIRFKLIKALIETVRTFQKVRNVKIIIALRADLLTRVLRNTTSSGFQEEKYAGLYLHVDWSKNQIIEVIGTRVRYLFKHQYTRDDVGLDNILRKVGQVEKLSPMEYILSRTFFRPREAIMFFNECIKVADGQAKISITAIRQAEVSYSRQRLESLYTEWRGEYPSLQATTTLLRGGNQQVDLGGISDEAVLSMLDGVFSVDKPGSGTIRRIAEEYFDEKCSKDEFLRVIFSVYYQIGLVGYKPGPQYELQWSHTGESYLAAEEFPSEAPFYVHPTFHIALNLS